MQMRIAAILGAVALAVTVTSCTHHTTGNTTSTTSTSSAAAATATPAPVAPVTGPHLPPFTPSAAVGANCQYTPSTDAAGKPAAPPHTGKVSTDPAEVGLTVVTNRGRIGVQLANNESPCTVNSFVTLAQGATLNLTGSSQTLLSLSDGAGGGGLLTNSGTSDITVTIGSGAFSGLISNGATNQVLLTKATSGTLILNGANTWDESLVYVM